MMGVAVSSFFASKATARTDAACAWAIVSSNALGEWASPHRNTPSAAKSTGRSLTCASKKKPSEVSGSFKQLAQGFIARICFDARAQHYQIGVQLDQLALWF
jgi:hypothetical protein